MVMATDELGALHEETEPVEMQLRKRLLEQDREMDKVNPYYRFDYCALMG